ncbi:uncharacterized protein [Nerophis lumbriciformis]|uniref:uncharacterized protein n=1 Tax=Nerophis lumbriciformis TaxID=546530 RepID=UPI003BAD9EA3
MAQILLFNCLLCKLKDVDYKSRNTQQECVGARARPHHPREPNPQTGGVVPREPGTTAPTQPSRPATGTPEPDPPYRPQGSAAGRRQTHPAEDRAREKQGTARPQASERPHPTRAERRDAPPEGPRDSPQPDGKTTPAPPATGPPRAHPPPPESAARPAPGHPTQTGRRRTTQAQGHGNHPPHPQGPQRWRWNNQQPPRRAPP